MPRNPLLQDDLNILLDRYGVDPDIATANAELGGLPNTQKPLDLEYPNTFQGAPELQQEAPKQDNVVLQSPTEMISNAFKSAAKALNPFYVDPNSLEKPKKPLPNIANIQVNPNEEPITSDLLRFRADPNSAESDLLKQKYEATPVSQPAPEAPAQAPKQQTSNKPIELSTDGLPEFEKSQMNFVRNSEFLTRISRNESGFGTNTQHRIMQPGEDHAGQHAIGVVGMIPDTIEEMANRIKQENPDDNSLDEIIKLRREKFPQLVGIEKNEKLKNTPEILALQGKYTDEMEKILRANPKLMDAVVDRLEKHVKRDTDDPRVAAYRWLYGHNLNLEDITEEMLAKADYVKKFGEDLDPKTMLALTTADKRALASTGATAVPQQAISTANSKDPLSSLMDAIYGPKLGMDALREAQGARDQMNLLAGMTAAGGKVAEALSRGAYKADNAASEAIRKSANAGIENIDQGRKLVDQNMAAKLKISDLNDKEEMRKSDSLLAKAYRSTAVSLNPDLAKIPGFENMTPEAIKALQPMLDVAIRSKLVALEKDRKLAEDKEKRLDKSEVDAAKMALQVQSPRGAAGQAEIVVQKMERLLHLAKDKDASPQEVYALATDLDSAIRGGMSTATGVKKFVPDTLSARFANALTMFNSHRNSAGLNDFVRRYEEIAQEMKAEATKAKNRHLETVAYGIRSKVRPEFYHGFRAQLGLPSEGSSEEKTSNDIKGFDPDSYLKGK